MAEIDNKKTPCSSVVNLLLIFLILEAVPKPPERIEKARET
jgi:hypothetical protein